MCVSLFLCVMTIIVLMICFFKREIIEYYDKNKGKDISLVKFAKNLKINMILSSDNYFKKEENSENT